MEKPLFIGIDAGGTKTAICAGPSPDHITHSPDGMGTNLRRDGLEHTASTLVQVIQETIRPYGPGSALYICAGIAGAATSTEREFLAKEMAFRLRIPIPHIQIKADASIAYYAAHNDRSGILVIAGTGSIIWARTKTGQMVRAGGWGALLGDEGGGFQIGLAALRALSREIDGGPITVLSTLLCDHCGLCTPSEILDFAYKEQEKIPTLAPYVLEAATQHDEVATGIVRTQVLALAESLKFLLLAHPHISPRVVYMGGLTKHTLYLDYLRKELLHIQDNLHISALPLAPSEAALHLAMKMRP